ncbi:MAG: hypothetical protein AAGC84_09090 [Pseudomonas sp.]
MHGFPDIDPPTPGERALKCVGLAAFVLIALCVLQPEFPARLYDLLLYGELTLLTCW